MARDDNPPDVSSRYRLQGLHAEGSLGRVWLAHDAVLSRVVALKELKPRFVRDAEARRRFLREAQVTSQLEHPYIVPVHELCEDSHYYTMTFVRGRTLQDAIAEHHQTDPADASFRDRQLRLLSTFLQVCEAVAYAHSRGIVHRDLKPANIMKGAFGEVFVLDWGLAKVEHHDSLGAVELTDDFSDDVTVAGRVMGTPGYMSPEQAAGRVEEIDARSDVYSLGAILFKILTGKSPHEQFEGNGPADYLKRIIEMPVPKARSVKPVAPPALEAIAAKALEKEPGRRYADPLALADDVRRWMDGLPTDAYREPWMQRAVRFLARHRTLTQAGAFALLTTCVVITGVIWQTVSDVRTLRRVQLASLEDHSNLLHAELAASLRDLRGSANLVSHTVRVEAFARSLTEHDREKQEYARKRVESLLENVVLSKPDCERIALVSAANDFRELVAVARSDESIQIVAAEDLLVLGKSHHFVHIAEVLDAMPGEYYISHFRKLESDADSADLILLAVKRVSADPNCWLTLQMNYRPFLRQLLADPHAKGMVTIICDEDRHTLYLHRTTENVRWLTTARDPLFEPFFADARLDTLVSKDFGPHRDVVYARKLHYDPGRPDRFLGVIMVAPYQGDLAGQFTASYILLAILIPVLVIVVAGVSFASSYLLKTRVSGA